MIIFFDIETVALKVTNNELDVNFLAKYSQKY